MSNQSGKLLSAVLVASFAGCLLAIASHAPARADDTCLSGPKATTPRGSHWYYRVEAGTKRHCWYLGDEHGKTAEAAAPKRSSAAAMPKPSLPAATPKSSSTAAAPGKPSLTSATTPSSPAATPDKPSRTSATTPLQPSVANARAEFTSTTNASDPTSPAPVTASSNGAAQTTDTSASTVATRWPDPAISATPDPAIGVTQAQTAPATAAKPSAQLLGERTETGPAVRVASAPAPEASSYSMPMLFGGLAGALALAALLGFAVVKFGSLNRFSKIRRRTDSIWDAADAGHPPPWQSRDDGVAPASTGNLLRPRREIEAQSRDIMEILSRASRETAT
ncbi:MAG: hypothetical protein JSS22_12190 [Proteobacteria bacterium]|nr:hypothetical protein [Pseudomonadota bacterium]